MSAPVLTGLFSWDRMNSAILSNWSMCELPPPNDCSVRHTCTNLTNTSVALDEDARRRLQQEWDLSFGEFQQMAARVGGRSLLADSCCDVPAPTACDEEEVAACHNISGNSYTVGKIVLCKPSLISLACSPGLLFTWPYTDSLPKGYYEIEDELYPYYFQLSQETRGDDVFLEDGSRLEENGTFEEYQEWVTSAAHSGDYTCQEILYPFTRACCPGYYCPAGEPCMFLCEVSGSYCPSSDTAFPEDDCPHMADNGYQDALGCGGSPIETYPCPAGNFCPNGSLLKTCPKDKYCHSGKDRASNCQFFHVCDEGSEFPGSSISMVIAVVTFLFICTVLLLKDRIVTLLLPIVDACMKTEKMKEWVGEEKAEKMKVFFKHHQEGEGFVLDDLVDTTNMERLGQITQGGQTFSVYGSAMLAEEMEQANDAYHQGAAEYARQMSGEVPAPGVAGGDGGTAEDGEEKEVVLKDVMIALARAVALMSTIDFAKLDADGDGQVTKEELKKALTVTGDKQVGEWVASAVFDVLDDDASGEISAEELVEWKKDHSDDELIAMVKQKYITSKVVLVADTNDEEDVKDGGAAETKEEAVESGGIAGATLGDGTQGVEMVAITSASVGEETTVSKEIEQAFRDSIRGQGQSSVMAALTPKEKEKKAKNERRECYHMDISFEEMSLKIKGSGLVVVQPCSGRIPAGGVTAIMGPSGAGKTSFLFALNGKAKSYAKIGGTMKINGEVFEGMDSMKDIVGFVPQDDTMSPQLTVRETLLYHARFRLPKAMSSEEVTQVVDETIELLQLEHVQDVIIGDEHQRGISGGQKKRVNIGMELVSRPVTIFLDEPTSGLDATTSNDVMRVLRTIADVRGSNVLVVLHQPRFEIFMQFDNLILLGVGGKPVYMGPTTHAIPHVCTQLKVEVPDNTNPADFLMDIIAERGEDLNKLWSEKCEEPLFRFEDRVPEEDRVIKEYLPRERPNVFVQTKLVFLRRFKIAYTRQVKAFLSDCVVTSMAGFIVGAISEQSSYDQVATNGFMMNLVTAILAINASMNDYGSERLVYYREASVGLNRVSYWLGQNLSSLVSSLILPWCFLCFYYTEFQPRGLLIDYWYVQTVYWFAIQTLAQFLSVCIDQGKAMIIGGALTVILNLTCGFEPQLHSLTSTSLGFAYTCINPSRWALEAQWLVETKGWGDVYDEYRDTIADEVGWKTDNLGTDMLGLLMLSFAVRLLTLAALYIVNSSKQL